VTGIDVTWPEVIVSDPEVTSFDRKSPGIDCRRPKIAYTVHFTSFMAAARYGRQSRDGNRRKVSWGPEVTRKWRHLTGSHLEVAGEWRKFAYTVHFTFYNAVARRERQSHDTNVTWLKVTGSDPEVTSFDWKSPGSGCRRPKTRVYCTFHFLQGCSSQEQAVMWRESTSHDLRWL